MSGAAGRPAGTAHTAPRATRGPGRRNATRAPHAPPWARPRTRRRGRGPARAAVGAAPHAPPWARPRTRRRGRGPARAAVGAAPHAPPWARPRTRRRGRGPARIREPPDLRRAPSSEDQGVRMWPRPSLEWGRRDGAELKQDP
ncbi:hypothetical protein BZB76_6559 [Actinomadura pelletieri DSM 43383]|uniref:Uncharacterized protein n=1 Tax=Actinomadura pelletieri DSM 43383 TaxID=1120940 RepID=A0A495QA58_9ACTN|nr:hypothetical protein BZB76_6559 [Actinomadura pelletieri DSM 43383]